MGRCYIWQLPPEVLNHTDLQKALFGFGAEPLHSTISAVSRANVDERNRFGRTALSFAAASGNIDVMEHLLRKGADPNSEDWQNDTPVSHAIKIGHPKYVQLLLDTGANSQHTDGEGSSLLALAVQFLSQESILNSLYDCKIINDRNHNGETPLCRLAFINFSNEDETRSIEVLNWLIEHGADINAKAGTAILP